MEKGKEDLGRIGEEFYVVFDVLPDKPIINNNPGIKIKEVPEDKKNPNLPVKKDDFNVLKEFSEQ